jgi:hypothetical protein
VCCRWGYKDIDVLEAVVANYSKAGLPLEGLWVDIEAMNNRFQVFTFDTGGLLSLLVPAAATNQYRIVSNTVAYRIGYHCQAEATT